jgi:DNA-directed RNA polymerase beta subunit
LNSIHVFTIKVPIIKTPHGQERVTRQIVNPHLYDLSQLDEKGLIKIGSYVKAGDILVSRVSPAVISDESPEGRLFMSLLGSSESYVRNKFFYLPNDYDKSFVVDLNVVKGSSKSSLQDNFLAKKLAGIKDKYFQILNRLIDREISIPVSVKKEELIESLLSDVKAPKMSPTFEKK